jgi:hypothetical protein
MIVKISSPIFARPDETVRVTANLIAKVDEIGNFSIETANPGGFWGTAVIQYPKELKTPKMMQTPTFASVVHKGEPKKIIEYPVLYPTWCRVVQYLNADQVPSVKARIEIADLSFLERVKRRFSRIEIDPPTERVY